MVLGQGHCKSQCIQNEFHRLNSPWPFCNFVNIPQVHVAIALTQHRTTCCHTTQHNTLLYCHTTSQHCHTTSQPLCYHVSDLACCLTVQQQVRCVKLHQSNGALCKVVLVQKNIVQCCVNATGSCVMFHQHDGQFVTKQRQVVRKVVYVLAPRSVTAEQCDGFSTMCCKALHMALSGHHTID